MTRWLTAYSVAARRKARLGRDWHGYLFENDRGGVMVTGAVYPLKRSTGHPDHTRAEPYTERRVRVSQRAAARVCSEISTLGYEA